MAAYLFVICVVIIGMGAFVLVLDWIWDKWNPSPDQMVLSGKRLVVASVIAAVPLGAYLHSVDRLIPTSKTGACQCSTVTVCK